MDGVRGLGGDATALRKLNTARVLRVLHRAGAVTLTELTKATELSRSAVEGAIEELLATGLVTEVEPVSGGPRPLGRPARRFRFRIDAGHVLGVHVSPHKVYAVLGDLHGEIVETRRVELTPDLPGPERLVRLRRTAHQCLQAAGITKDDLWAVAVGTPGLVGRTGKISLCSVLDGWTGLDLAGELGAHFPCPVLVENDANTAAMGERWRGVARDIDDVVCVLADHKLGVGVVIDGRVHRGSHGAAGELGALPNSPWAAANDFLVNSEHDPARVFADPRAAAEVADFVEALANGIATMALAVDPELVVLGGVIADCGPALLERLSARVPGLCLTPPRLVLSELVDDAVALGALRVALDEAEKRLFAISAS
ncbi:ROK family transcriptional regulator [Allokutzneria albata]|uniref:Sugar kinase of the NBD/HSP70 family, may contain an N-terminal HTH domain n=1 Tax=Allokutzneria albata TaxID=211114 RepID=A0A1G9RLU5_ALLAB|nr:ROK family transcriptional regulator [Allokutzneria albata]SDM23897.1 Sugar kinase of the NBD/HSP70 family, may contain an N-terminal HTH domain [Allokutzneria albata]